MCVCVCREGALGGGQAVVQLLLTPPSTSPPSDCLTKLTTPTPRTHPHTPEALVALVRSLIALGRSQEAAQLLRRCLLLVGKGGGAAGAQGRRKQSGCGLWGAERGWCGGAERGCEGLLGG